MSEISWQEWCRNNITNAGLNPKSAAAKAWVYKTAKIEERDKRIALLEAELEAEKTLTRFYKNWALEVGISVPVLQEKGE